MIHRRSKAKIRRRTAIKKQLRIWHWVSSAICLAGLILFSVTGITLNHARTIPANPSIETIEDKLPTHLMPSVSSPETQDFLPADISDWLRGEFGFIAVASEPEWSRDELYVAQPRPGGDQWIAIDRASGEFLFERTDRGFIAWLNDLHKGRDTSTAWRLGIDIFAVASCVFGLTGLALLAIHSKRRPSTWPLTALGIILPALVLWLFGH